jgi:DNA polymerase-3 subunit alpha
VLPPHIKSSELDFVIEDQPDGVRAIRYGLGAIKNVGEGAVMTIVEARQTGPFSDISEFCQRVDLRSVGKRALESLIKVGALEQFGARPRLLASLERMVSISGGAHKASDVGQMSLFGESTGVSLDFASSSILVDNVEIEPTPREMLQWERELVGVYISEHPLNRLSGTIRRIVSAYSTELSELDHNRQVTMAGIVTYVRPHTTKTGKAMAFAGIEDLSGQIEVIIWPSTWEETKDLWQADRLLLLRGKIDAERGEPKLLCDTATTNFDVVVPVDANGETVEYDEPPMPSASMGDYDAGDEPPSGFENMPGIELAPAGQVPSPQNPPSNGVPVSGKPATGRLETHPVAAQLRAKAAAVASPPPPPSGRFVPPSPVTAPVAEAQVATVVRSHIRVIAQRTGDPNRDNRILERIHGALVSQPGHDTFSIALADGDDIMEFEFPKNTTSCTPALLEKLARIVPSESIEISPGG